MHRIFVKRPDDAAECSAADSSWQFSPDSYTDFYGGLHHDHLAGDNGGRNGNGGGNGGGNVGGAARDPGKSVGNNSWIYGYQEPLPRDAFRPVEVPAAGKDPRGERRSSLTLLLKSSTEPGVASSNEGSPRYGSERSSPPAVHDDVAAAAALPSAAQAAA